MTKFKVEYIKEVVSELLAEIPPEKRSHVELARRLELRSSDHISCLFRIDRVSPTLYKRLVVLNKLDPKRAQRKRRPRFSLAADDPEMAMKQLEKYYPGTFFLNVQEKC
jgi:hypothetical protein